MKITKSLKHHQMEYLQSHNDHKNSGAHIYKYNRESSWTTLNSIFVWFYVTITINLWEFQQKKQHRTEFIKTKYYQRFFFPVQLKLACNCGSFRCGELWMVVATAKGIQRTHSWCLVRFSVFIFFSPFQFQFVSFFCVYCLTGLIVFKSCNF